MEVCKIMKTKRKLKKREGQRVVILPEYKNRIKNGLCPICSKPKNEWNRRKDWRCCSKECTNKWNKDIYIWSWQQLRLRIFRRDNFTCVKCGFKARIQREIYDDEWKKYLDDNYIIFEINEKEAFVGNESQLIADHIMPISLGGDEWDINNIQTLCKDCNRKKTNNDFKKIAIARRNPISQQILGEK